MWSCTECTPFSDERKVICFIVDKISIINTGLYKDLCVVINGVFSKNFLILNNNPIILMTLLNKFCKFLTFTFEFSSWSLFEYQIENGTGIVRSYRKMIQRLAFMRNTNFLHLYINARVDFFFHWETQLLIFLQIIIQLISNYCISCETIKATCHQIVFKGIRD